VYYSWRKPYEVLSYFLFLPETQSLSSSPSGPTLKVGLYERLGSTLTENETIHFAHSSLIFTFYIFTKFYFDFRPQLPLSRFRFETKERIGNLRHYSPMTGRWPTKLATVQFAEFWQLEPTKSPTMKNGPWICLVVNNSAVHCQIVLKFGRVMHMVRGFIEVYWSNGRPQVAIQC